MKLFRFRQELAIDLGTANTVIFKDDKIVIAIELDQDACKPAAQLPLPILLQIVRFHREELAGAACRNLLRQKINHPIGLFKQGFDHAAGFLSLSSLLIIHGITGKTRLFGTPQAEKTKLKAGYKKSLLGG